MRRRNGLLAIVFALALIGAACGDDSDDSGATDGEATDTTAADSGGEGEDDTGTDAGDDAGSGAARLVIERVDPASATVVLANRGDGAIGLSGLWLCNRPNYTDLPAEMLEPGATVEIDAGAIAIGPDDGEVALYRSNNFDSSDDILAYVQWGDGGHGRESVAVDAGIWSDGDFVDNGGAAFSTTADAVSGSASYTIEG